MNKQLSQIIRGAIIAHYGTVAAFAAAVGLSSTSVNRVLRGESPYGAARRERWEKKLSIMAYDAAVVVVVPTGKLCDKCENKRMPGPGAGGLFTGKVT